MDVENRIIELVDILNKYSKAYYIDNSPLVSDVEYDRLYKELEDLEKNILNMLWKIVLLKQ